MIRRDKNITLAFLPQIRQYAANFFYKLAFALLLVSFLIFIWMWVYAYTNNLIPDTPWGEKMGNHGPWRRLGYWQQGFNLRDAFWYIVNFQFYSMCLALISFFLKPYKRAINLFTITLVIFSVFLYSHYWLVD